MTKPYTKKPAQVKQDEVSGKLPPQALDLEQAVLGAVLLDRDAISVIVEILNHQHFYKTQHQIIFRAVENMYSRGEPIDILTVTQFLRKTGELESVGGAYYISQLTNRVASAGNAEFHGRIVLQKYMQRELIRMSHDLSTKGYDESTDVFELIDQAQTTLINITSRNIKGQEKDVTKAFGELFRQVEKARQIKTDVTGVPTGIADLDKHVSGWQDTDLIIIAGRPGMGKTAFTKACIQGALSAKIPTIMFSLEMSCLQLMTRLMSEDIMVPSTDILKGRVDDEGIIRMNHLLPKYYSDNHEPLLFIDDTPSLTINELKAKTKRIIGSNPVFRKSNKFQIIVDYLQLVEATRENNNNKNEEISEVTRGLKTMAKDLNCPVIALSQLNRKVEETADKRPTLSHLRESGAIEQDADIVGMLYRPEYYYKQGHEKFQEIPFKGNGDMIRCDNYAELIIAKYRNGSIDTIPLRFDARYTKFSSWDSELKHQLDYTKTQPLVDSSNKDLSPNNGFLTDPDFSNEPKPF